MAQIFLSYARQDAEAAKALAGELSAVGHQVWWDKDISGGSQFATEIERALNAAEVVMVLWSEAAVKSPWVLDEAAEGRDTGRLLPIALNGCKPPLGFRQYQTIAVMGARPDEALKEIVAALARKSGSDPRSHITVSAQAAARPNSVGAHCARAHELGRRGRLDEAQSEVDAALAHDPDSWEANSSAAHLMYLRGDAGKAMAFCQKALTASKSDFDSASLMISCCRALEDTPGCIKAAEMAVARAEQSIAAGTDVGPAFAAGAKGLAVLGERERARKWARKALNVDPGNLPMRYNVACTLAAFLDEHGGAMDVIEAFAERLDSRAHLQLLERDPDWNGIRESRDFQSLLSRARKRIEALEATGFQGQPVNAG